jgi:hypothetical protein
MIERYADLRGYFRERLVSALERRRVHFQETTECYLVQLMARFADGASASEVAEPLVYRMAEALETREPVLRFRRFRDTGDAALYVLGFFQDHLDRRGISRGYVVTMGGRAYGRASELATVGGGVIDGGFSEAYGELADRFDECAKVLDELREETELRTPQDVVRLYDRWKRTRSPALAERLRAAGVYPQRDPGATLH